MLCHWCYRNCVQVLAICSAQAPASRRRRINFEGLAFASEAILGQNMLHRAVSQLGLPFLLNNSTFGKRSDLTLRLWGMRLSHLLELDVRIRPHSTPPPLTRRNESFHCLGCPWNKFLSFNFASHLLMVVLLGASSFFYWCQTCLLICAGQERFHNATDGGGGYSPQHWGTTGPIYKIQTAFDRSG